MAQRRIRHVHLDCDRAVAVEELRKFGGVQAAKWVTDSTSVEDGCRVSWDKENRSIEVEGPKDEAKEIAQNESGKGRSNKSRPKTITSKRAERDGGARETTNESPEAEDEKPASISSRKEEGKRV